VNNIALLSLIRCWHRHNRNSIEERVWRTQLPRAPIHKYSVESGSVVSAATSRQLRSPQMATESFKIRRKITREVAQLWLKLNPQTASKGEKDFLLMVALTECQNGRRMGSTHVF
jgi:hypothetical protein